VARQRAAVAERAPGFAAAFDALVAATRGIAQDRAAAPRELATEARS
jgi:hypothetical protein